MTSKGKSPTSGGGGQQQKIAASLPMKGGGSAAAAANAAASSGSSSQPLKPLASATSSTTTTTAATAAVSGGGPALLSVRYPVNSTWEFTLQIPEHEEIVSGDVYCTDEISQTIVLQKPLVHTTTSFEIRMVQVPSIKKEKLIRSSAENNNANNSDVNDLTVSGLSTPLPVIQKKVLDEREKRAIRLAEESFKHINQNVSFNDNICIIIMT